LGLEIDNTVYALDSTTVDLSLTLFPWASFRKTKAGIKMHTQIDLRGPIPTCIFISAARQHDVRWMDDLIFELGAIYVIDRGYMDFARLHLIAEAGAFFVTRAKDSQILQACLPARGPIHGSSQRPNRKAQAAESAGKLPLAHAQGALFRRGNREELGFSDEQFEHSGFDCCQTLSIALAYRTVLPMDQRPFAYQALLRHQPQCRKDSDLDRRERLPHGGHHSQAAETAGISPQNFATFEHSPV
jgi:hypothetical protein